MTGKVIPFRSKINIASDTNICLPESTKVILEGALVFEYGGQIVGKLNAEYDFKDLDPRFHWLAVQFLMSQRMRVVIPTREAEQTLDRTRQDENKRSLPLYKRFFKRLFG